MTDQPFDPLAYAEDRTIDVVERIYGSYHSRTCNYVPEISPIGLIYCRTCACQINSLMAPNGPWDNTLIRKMTKVSGNSK